VINLNEILENDSGINKVIENALEEDIGPGDITTETLINQELEGSGNFIAKQDMIVCGVPVAEKVLKKIDENCSVLTKCPEGKHIKKGTIIAHVEGKYGKLLTAERTALNFLTHLSGIATLVSEFVSLTAETGAGIYDTRKTLPGLRMLEKYAVAMGGGKNHRIGLYDAILIKNNHLAACLDIPDMIHQARENASGASFVEVEVETLDQVKAAVKAGPDIIMLDNMDIPMIRKSRELIPETIEVEVSGNVSKKNVRQIAECRVTRISIGALTHSAPSADISLHLFPIK